MTTDLAAMHEFGGHGPTLHIAHANGFPPGTYRQLAAGLVGAYRVIGLPARPLWPGTRPQDTPTWRPMATDLIAGLEASGWGPVTGVGHSLGGVVTLWAAIDRPDLFRCVILIDPVILPPRWLWSIRTMRWLGLAERQPFVQAALRRRRAWPDCQACFDHLRDKRVFARWSDAALWDYVNSGTTPQPSGGVMLRYPPEWEAHVYATTPVRIWEDVPRLGVPALIIRGEQSETFVPEAAARVARLLPAAMLAEVPDAGHLVAMEKPQQVASLIHDFVEQAEVCT